MLHEPKKAINNTRNLASRNNYLSLRKAVTRLYKTFEPREESACLQGVDRSKLPTWEEGQINAEPT